MSAYLRICNLLYAQITKVVDVCCLEPLFYDWLSQYHAKPVQGSPLRGPQGAKSQPQFFQEFRTFYYRRFTLDL